MNLKRIEPITLYKLQRPELMSGYTPGSVTKARK
jgi:hypothetical protein